jgi:hypothetical protein
MYVSALYRYCHFREIYYLHLEVRRNVVTCLPKYTTSDTRRLLRFITSLWGDLQSDFQSNFSVCSLWL